MAEEVKKATEMKATTTSSSSAAKLTATTNML
jgi:hypothetical protein